MKLISAPLDGKNISDDSLREEVFNGCYEARDSVGLHSHMVGHILIDEDDIYLDGIVEARWQSNWNVIQITLLACPSQADFAAMGDSFIKHFERVFKAWECPENEALRVSFERIGNTGLNVSLWFEID